jgi:hypothetical protein
MKRAILLLNLGGPETQDDVKPFLYRLFFDPEIIRIPFTPLRMFVAWMISTTRAEKSKALYQQIGGGSPIRRLTDEQAQKLEQKLARKDLLVRTAFSASKPLIEDVVSDLRSQGVERFLSLPLYPQYSYTTTKGAPSHFPDDEYDIWGAEFIQVRNSMLPIRTYPEFEHKFGEPEVQYKDPMASLMDVMSSLQKGEQLWYQVVILPCNQEWVHEKDHLISKILKEKLPATKANNFVDGILKWMGAVSESIYQLWGDIEEKEKKPDDPLRMINLEPGVKKQVEGAELKASKLGFETKIRAIYISRKEILNKQKVVSGFVGFIKQFNTNDLNALKPDTKVTMTKALYFFTKYRLNRKKWKIMRAYKGRSDNKGRKMWLMNVEELASIWHFPIDAVVKMPLVQRAGARRVEPPMSLPFDDGPKKMSANREPIFDDDFEIEPASVAEKNSEANLEKTMPHEPKFMEEETNEPVEELAVPSPKRGEAPPNLPFVD